MTLSRSLATALLGSLLAAFALLPCALRAQGVGAAVETPMSFDSAGRVVAITPSVAARLQLVPPAWRITGDYEDARLYRSHDTSYVIVVTRGSGAVERYPLTANDVRTLRARTSTLPPGLEEQLGEGLQRAGRNIGRATNDAFVRDQTILGFAAYAPAFAVAVTRSNPGRIASYLLAAGASFFTAAEIARQTPVSAPTNRLATHAGAFGSLIGLATAYAAGGSDQARGAGALVGGIGGTAAAITFGSDLTAGQSAASRFGALAGAVTALGGVLSNRERADSGDLTRPEAGILAGATVAGYILGAAYPKVVSYNVTPGDVGMLATTGALGVLGASALVANGQQTDKTIARALTAGWVTGLLIGDLSIVRRLDVADDEAPIIAAGAGAGALMGAGIAALAGGRGTSSALVRGMAAGGGVVGLALTSRYVSPHYDAGRIAQRIDLDPTAFALAAARVPGEHAVLRMRF
ncbi:MAG: hypothetical protein NVS9B3_13350 [Gemmatimonadaceae bacterium]